MREGIGKEKAAHIKSWSSAAAETLAPSTGQPGAGPTATDRIDLTIADWGRGLGLDAVVWTGLPPGDFGNPPSERAPTEQEALEYLNACPHEHRLVAEEYFDGHPYRLIRLSVVLSPRSSADARRPIGARSALPGVSGCACGLPA